MPKPRRANSNQSMSDSTASHGESEKECKGCGAQRLLTYFGKHIGGAGGIRARCKPCLNEDSRDHYQRMCSEQEPASDTEPVMKGPKCYEPIVPGSDLYVMALSTDPDGAFHGLKVGRSGNIPQRANNLCESMPFSIIVLLVIPGAGHIEKAVHALLEPTRNTAGRGREWFKSTLPNILHAVGCAMQSHHTANGRPAPVTTGAE